MTRIEKIRQMTDEELAEFLSKVASYDGKERRMEAPETVRGMTAVELANYLSDLDAADYLGTCTNNCPIDSNTDCDDVCAECCLRWLHSEGPLMDGEG